VVDLVAGVVTIATGNTRLARPASTMIGASQLSLHSPIVLLLENPESDLALD
jgi:hypothetical protein